MIARNSCKDFVDVAPVVVWVIGFMDLGHTHPNMVKIRDLILYTNELFWCTW